MEISKIVAENLKRLRKERNLSLGQLASNADVSKVLLSQIETGALIQQSTRYGKSPMD